jgi:flavin reductase (DIM6/NTAB) family NADH-FMN oxidoreductase RutF
VAPNNTGETRLREACLRVLGHVPSPVAIVTLRVDGRPWGVTVSSFLSVTLDPPKVLVSLFRHTLAAQRITESGTFGVSLLSTEQQLVAETSARPGTPKFLEAFCGELDLFQVDEYGVTGSPGNHEDEPLAPPRVHAADHFQCDLDQSIIVDDHVLLVGRVTDVAVAPRPRDPLVYVDRVFATVTGVPA